MAESSHLDNELNRRRLELGLTWRQLASEARTTYETLRAMRRAEGSASQLTRRNLERALRWAPGALDLVEQGGRPEVMPPESHPEPAAAPPVPPQDPRVDAILTIIDGLPTRVRLQVLQALDDRLAGSVRRDDGDTRAVG